MPMLSIDTLDWLASSMNRTVALVVCFQYGDVEVSCTCTCAYSYLYRGAQCICTVYMHCLTVYAVNLDTLT